MADLFFLSLPSEFKDRIEKNIPFSKIDSATVDKANDDITKLKKDLEKLLQEKNILQEQESNKVLNFDKEEKALKWNEDGLAKAREDTKSILYFEQQLEAAKRNYQKNIDFWESRVSVSKAELEAKQNKISKPLVKVNVKLQDLETKMENKQKIIDGFKEWCIIKTQLELYKQEYVLKQKTIKPK